MSELRALKIIKFLLLPALFKAPIRILQRKGRQLKAPRPVQQVGCTSLNYCLVSIAYRRRLAAVVAETAGNAQSASGTNITEIDDTSATATTEAEPTSKKSASQVGDTSAAGNTAAVASSIVGDSSAYEASIQSEDAVS